MYHGSGCSQGYEIPACNPWKPSYRTALRYRNPLPRGGDITIRGSSGVRGDSPPRVVQVGVGSRVLGGVEDSANVKPHQYSAKISLRRKSPHFQVDEMAIFQADCPHCGTKKVALAIQHEFKCVKHPSLIWDTLAICGQCSRGVLATFDTPRNNSPKSLIGGGSQPRKASLNGTDSSRHWSAGIYNPTMSRDSSDKVRKMRLQVIGTPQERCFVRHWILD